MGKVFSCVRAALLALPHKAGKFSFVRGKPDMRLRLNIEGGGGRVKDMLAALLAPANQGNSSSLQGSIRGTIHKITDNVAFELFKIFYITGSTDGTGRIPQP
ncbi:hypothetical protein GQX74_009371 [Glossina fuscipes]|nr:hypothetical protein GQX74_009371 [Glossina fuscipes]